MSQNLALFTLALAQLPLAAEFVQKLDHARSTEVRQGSGASFEAPRTRAGAGPSAPRSYVGSNSTI